ncbi:MAG: hypothetical protein HRU17_03500 [Polyangiaceae bacterium]|nr:hypothetical protein [Polyangiaceae bacterium]
MRPSSLIVCAALAGFCGSLALTVDETWAGSGLRKDTIGVEEIKRGMKGYGLTVFEGTTPEKFDVEVIDILKNFRPGQDLILVKTTHPRLEIVKVVAGMSGSPIFFNGKMAGAYAYGWTFGSEPVAGVTPIKNMIHDLERPLPNWINGFPLRFIPKGMKAKPVATQSQKNRYTGRLDDYDLKQHASQLAKSQPTPTQHAGMPLRPVSTPLLMGGIGAGGMALVSDLLSPFGMDPLQAGGGGGTDPNAPTAYVDGGAVGIQMVRGDMSAMGLGTVTRVEGNKVSAFGHPMMNAGVTALPAAIGRVVWFLASQYRSFKLGMPARTVGSLVNDRQASIVVDQSITAPTVPMRVKINGAPGAPKTEWNFELCHEKFMTPTFVAVTLGNSVQATAADRQDVSWQAKSVIKIRGLGQIELEDFGVSVGGTPDPREFSSTNVVRAVGALLNNPWKPIFIESIQTEINLKYSRDILRLRGVTALEKVVDEGGKARLRLSFLQFSGDASHQVVAIPIPRHLSGRKLSLSIAPGYTVQRPRAAPDSLSELIANLENPIYPPQSVVVSYSAGTGVSFRGRVASRLPPGALDALQPSSTTIAPEPYNSQVHHVIPMSKFVIGKDTASIRVNSILR